MPSGVAGIASGPDRAAVSFTVSIGTGSDTAAAHGVRPRQIILRTGAQPNYCELVLEDRVEGYAAIPENTPVKVQAWFPGSAAGGAASITVFVGRVSGRGAQWDPDSETISIICLGPRWDLAKDYVLGQEHLVYEKGATDKTPGARTVACVTALPCVFNAAGKGNKAPIGKTSADDFHGLVAYGFPVFHPDPRVRPATSLLWTAAEMIEYCYRQRLRTYRREFRASMSDPAARNYVGDPLSASFAAPARLKSDVLYGLNVNTLPLGEAFDKVLATAGYRWWIKPIGVGDSPYGELKCELKSFAAALGASIAALPGGGIVSIFPAAKALYLPLVDAGRILPAAAGGTSVAVDGPNLGAAGVTANAGRGLLNEDHSRVISDVVACGETVRFQFEVLLGKGWRLGDEIELLKLDSGETALGRIGDLKTKVTEATAGAVWDPSIGDPTKAYFGDVGRLFLIDQTGYELVDTAGAPSYIPKLGEIGSVSFESPVVPRPRPFLAALLATLPLHATGPGVGVARHRRPAQLEIHHPDLETPANPSGFVGVPEGAWAFEPDRGAIRINDANLARLPYFNHDRAGAFDSYSGPVTSVVSPFADRAKITVVVESDWLQAAIASGATGGVEARGVVMADHEYSAAGAGDDLNAQLAKFAGKRLALNNAPIKAASFSIPWLAIAYEPCDWITKVIGRGIDVYGQVVEVRLDCDAQDTHIQLEDVRLFVGEAS